MTFGIDSFANALPNIGLGSKWNPRGSNNNCVFVTVAYLLGMDVEELLRRTGSKGPSHASGADLRDIENLLRSLGRRFFWTTVGKHQTPQPGSVTGPEKLGNIWGVCYVRRGNTSGHCVVARRPGGVSALERGEVSFTCYQHSDSGENVANDIFNSSQSLGFWII